MSRASTASSRVPTCFCFSFSWRQLVSVTCSSLIFASFRWFDSRDYTMCAQTIAVNAFNSYSKLILGKCECKSHDVGAGAGWLTGS